MIFLQLVLAEVGSIPQRHFDAPMSAAWFAGR
jgi:hypothetical protein